MSVDVRRLSGTALEDAIADIAHLRIEVFREWPYLYDGDLVYEMRYLQPYLTSAGACVLGAYDGDQLVGAATATPLIDHADDFAAAFAKTSYALDTVYYCAESVLLPAYRGRGLGHRFFDLRENEARALGFTDICFAAVQRSSDHPARPTDYRPLYHFWRGRGYAPLEGVVAGFSWKDLDMPFETSKPLQFWHRAL